MQKEIIVYLDDYKYSGDGNYDTMYLDFRTAADFEAYWQIVNQPQVKEEPVAKPAGTYLQIDGYRSPRRLFRGAYYSLNVAMLKQLKPQLVPDSLVFAHYYNFGNYQGQNTEAFHLLQTHEPLNPKELESSRHNKIEQLEEVLGLDYLKFRVHDVSQANWNEILQEDNVLFVFDIGAPLHAKAGEVERYINTYAARYPDDKPVLMLSHWDVDHYHCLLKMSADEIKNRFTMFICPDKMKSSTSQRIYNKVVEALGKDNVNSLELPRRTENSDYPQIHLKYGNQGLRLYIGERSRSTNYSGIILYVEGTRGNVILSGDSLLVQTSDVLADAAPVEPFKKEHHLVVPHHGGDFKGKKIYKTYIIPDHLTAKYAIISVDEVNNSYGHPSGDMIDNLSSVANWEILRTDRVKQSLSFDLSWNLLEERMKEHEQELNEYYAKVLMEDSNAGLRE